MDILNCTNFIIPENYHGFIYKTIFPNGKIYVGQSTNNVRNKYFGSGTKVHSFIKSKGLSGVKREILKFCKSQLELDKWEMIFIKKYDSTNTEIGYNIIQGAATKFNPMKNPESVEKLRNYVINNHPLRGKKNTEEYKKRMSDILKQRKFSGVDNPMFGKDSHNKGKIAINNGVVNRYINRNEEIPIGFSLGLRKNKNQV